LIVQVLSNFSFLFSSIRRHTRSKRDWSSDVCSSDLQSTLLTNVGSIGNKGVELHLSFAAIDKGDFQWNLDVTGSSLSNKMISFSDRKSVVLGKSVILGWGRRCTNRKSSLIKCDVELI